MNLCIVNFVYTHLNVRMNVCEFKNGCYKLHGCLQAFARYLTIGMVTARLQYR